MDDSNQKRSKKEDLDLVKMAILQSRSRPIDLQMTNPEARKRVEKDHDKEEGENLAKQFERGYQALIQEIKKSAVDGLYSREDTVKPLPIEDFQISQDKMKEVKKIVSEENNSDGAIDRILDFSPDIQLLFYERGIYFYDQALYDKSIDVFVFLTMINPKVQSFWIGLALSYEKNLNYNQAIECLEGAIRCDSSDFTPFYGLLRCSEAIKDYSKLEELLEASKDNEAIKEEVADVLEYLHPTNSE